MNVKINYLRLMAGLFMAAGLLSACGGGGPEQVSVSMREFSFSPDQLTVPAGTEVTLTLRNLGALDHNFHFMQLGEEVSESWTDADEAGAYYSQGVIKGGGVETVTFTAPNVPGDYQFLCSIPSHFELGMVGVLTVTEP